MSTPARCGDCGSSHPAAKIAHEDALDEPVGYLCFRCFQEWLTVTDFEEGCLVCGKAAEYHSVREISDLDGEKMYAPGVLSVCEEHVDEVAGQVGGGDVK